MANDCSTLYDDIIFVKIGAAQTRFGIHRTLLTKASTFFQEILRPNFKSEAQDIIVTKEGDSTVVLLTEENSEVFARVNSWLYSGKLLTPSENWKDIPWNHLIAVYLFSVERGITRLHNKCIDAAIQKTKDGGLFPSQMTVNALYDLDFRAAPLRKLIVKLFAVRCDLRSAILSNSNYHQTFLNSLVIELYDMQKEDIKCEEVNVWASRGTYYTYGSENPICVD